MRRATWFFWPVTLIVYPNWFSYIHLLNSYRVPPDLLVPLIALPVFALDSGGGVRLRFCDVLVIGLVACNCISFLLNNAFSPYQVVWLTLTGLTSYFLGRQYLRNDDDLYPMLQSYCVAMVLIAVLAYIETFAHISIVNRLVGIPGGGAVRYGMLRARLGTVGTHSMIMSMFFWVAPSFEAARWAREGMGPRWWRHLPLIVMGVLLAGASRTSLLAILGIFFGRMFFGRPALRVPLLVGSLTVILIALSNTEMLFDFLDSIEDTGGGRVTEIVVNGQPRLYSSARHRILLYEVYRDKMWEAGAFGFDRSWQGTMPAHLLVFSSVDNYYIQQRLGRGLVGLLLMDLLIAVSIFTATRFAIRTLGPPQQLAAGLATAMTTAMICWFTLPMLDEVLKASLWAMGVTASLPALGKTPPYGAETQDDYDDIVDADDEEPLAEG